MPSSAYIASSVIYILSLHDALPIFVVAEVDLDRRCEVTDPEALFLVDGEQTVVGQLRAVRDPGRLVCRLGDRLGAELSDDGLFTVQDRKSTRLNSSHTVISYAVFCLHRLLRDLHSFPTRRSSDLRGCRS